MRPWSRCALTAVIKYCGDHYGLMLYYLFDEVSGKYVRCWGTLAKFCSGVPSSTYKYFVPNLLAYGFLSIRTTLLTRYVSFFRSLLKSRSLEEDLVASLAGRDRSSTTDRNLYNIQLETGLNPMNRYQAGSVRQGRTIPVTDIRRLPLLKKLLIQRRDMEVQCSNTNGINSLINSPCSSSYVCVPYF